MTETFIMDAVPLLFDSFAPRDKNGPVRQIDRLQTVLQFIKENPKLHKQGVWHCKTAGCFAGLTVDMAGGVWEVLELHSGFSYLSELVDIPKLQATQKDGNASEFARRLLGLTYNEAISLFHEKNSIEDLAVIVEALSDPTKTIAHREDVPEHLLFEQISGTNFDVFDRVLA